MFVEEEGVSNFEDAVLVDVDLLETETDRLRGYALVSEVDEGRQDCQDEAEQFNLATLDMGGYLFELDVLLDSLAVLLLQVVEDVVEEQVRAVHAIAEGVHRLLVEI